MELLRDSVTSAIQQLHNGSKVVNVFDMVTIFSGGRKEAEAFEAMKPPFMYLGTLYGVSYVDYLLSTPTCIGHAIFMPEKWVKKLPLDTLRYLIGHEICHILLKAARIKFRIKDINDLAGNLEESICDVFGFMLSDYVESDEVKEAYKSGLTLAIPAEHINELELHLEGGDMRIRREYVMRALSDNVFCFKDVTINVFEILGRSLQYLRDVGWSK